MMQIKFKAWDLERKEMGVVHTILVGSNTAQASFHNGRLLHGKIGTDLILMRFTGLTDKRGREIYEGDIVQQSPVPQHLLPQNRRGIVTYSRRQAMFHVEMVRGQGKYSFSNFVFEPVGNKITDLKVIGNIYEKPELFC